MRGAHRSRVLALLLALSLVTFGAVGTAAADEIVFVDWSWASAEMHNRVAGFILEHGYGYDTEYTFADTAPGFQGMRRGDIDISMEMWIDNILEIWNDGVESGDVIDLGPNFPNAPQGWYVPTYMIEGDPERGIEPIAPDLTSIEQLPKYWELFKDPENPRKGRFYSCTIGWLCDDINLQKLETYGLDEYYNSFPPGSQAALETSIMRAYEAGEPWFGYYWEPTWLMGMLDMTMLEEPAYTDECWETDMGCAYPASRVHVAINAELQESAPEIVEFLGNYETTLEQTNAALAYMQETGGETSDAAMWFLNEYKDIWTQWLPADVVAKVQDALKSRL